MRGPATESILFVAPNSYVLRNWVASGLADRCVDELGLEPVFLTHFDDPGFSSPAGRFFANRPVPLQAVRGNELPAGYPAWLYAQYYLRLRIAAQELPYGGGQLLALARKRDWLARVLPALRTAAPRGSRRRSCVRAAFDRLAPRVPAYRATLRALNPRCVVVGTPGILFLDQLLTIAARHERIPVQCVVNSWDNLVSRGPMARWPDRLMVWNGFMRRHAVDVHGFPEDRIDVVGSLQFSQYATPVTADERHTTRRRAGLADDEPYFLFLGTAECARYEEEDVRTLLGILDDSEFAGTSLVVRLHPQADAHAFSGIRHPALRLDKPPRFAGKGGDGLSFGQSEIRAMAALLTDAEVVFASAGTTALLEAAIFERPTIQFRWMDHGARADERETARIRDYQRYIHIQDFDRTGARLFSDDPATLLRDLRTMLANVEEWAARRRRAVEALVRTPIGDAPDRVIEVLRRELPGTARTPKRRRHHAGGKPLRLNKVEAR